MEQAISVEYSNGVRGKQRIFHQISEIPLLSSIYLEYRIPLD